MRKYGVYSLFVKIMCIIIPTFLVFFVSDTLISISVKKELHQAMLGAKETAVEYISNALDEKFDNLSKSVYAFVYSDICTEYLDQAALIDPAAETTDASLQSAYDAAESELFLSFFRLIEQNNIIISCGIITENGNYSLRNPYYYAFTDEMMQQLSSWKPSGSGGELISMTYQDKHLMFFICPLPSRYNGGFFAALINNSTISECITTLSGHSNSFYLLNEHGKQFYTYGAEPLTKALATISEEKLSAEYLTIGEDAFLSRKLDSLPIYVLIKLQSDYPHETVETLYRNSLIFQIVCTVIAAFILMTFFRSFTRRLETMTDTMSNLEINRPDVQFDDSAKDELGLLGHHLNKMVARIQHQIEELAWKQEQIRVSQLQALQNQINPHFLYNALEHTRMVALTNHDREAAKMIQVMAQILRYNISNDLVEVPVQDECIQIKRYLTLQKELLQDRLVVETEIDDRVYLFKIIKFVLQPLVENALRHGIEPKAAPSRLQIHLTIQNDCLHAVVQDNGIGIPEEQLQRLQSLLQQGTGPSTSSHVGLKNVNDRLVLFYGNSAKLQLESQEGVGTTVTFSVPLHRLSHI